MPVHQIPNSKQDNLMATRLALTLLSLYVLALIPYHEYLAQERNRKDLLSRAQRAYMERKINFCRRLSDHLIKISRGNQRRDAIFVRALEYSVADRWSAPYDEFLSRVEEANRIQIQLEGPEHPHSIQITANLLFNYLELNQLTKAAKLEEKERPYLSMIYRVKGSQTGNLLKELTRLYKLQGRLPDSIKTQELYISNYLTLDSSDRFQRACAEVDLARDYLTARKYKESKALFQHALTLIDGYEKIHPEFISLKSAILSALATANVRDGHYSLSDKLFSESLSLDQITYPDECPYLRAIGMEVAIDGYIQMKKFDRAEALLKELRNLATRTQNSGRKDMGSPMRSALTQRVDALYHKLEKNKGSKC